MKKTTCPEIKKWLLDDREFALLDVREDGFFGEGHLLHAISLPYSRLELDIGALVPRAETPVFVADHGEGVAAKAAARLADMGYTDVAILEDDLASCEAQGFTIFKGVNVPSKTLGEIAEEVGHTPFIEAEEYKRMLDDGEDFILLDGRSPREFNNFSIPGGRSCPNAELPYRLPLLVSSPKTKVVVNCAGRTRSLVGAQTLRNFGFENEIVALKNGTQGWRLAGFDLDHGRTVEPLPAVEGSAMEASKALAASFMKDNGIPTVNAATVATWAQDTSRTLYVFDVRTKEEFDAKHIEGSLYAAGGQLVQGTDKWVGTRGARIVLVDDGNVRAANSAYWLRAMGHEAYVLEDDASDPTLNLSIPTPALKSAAGKLPEIPAADVASDGGVQIVDLRASAAYRAAHIEGAQWSIRPKLSSLKLDPGAAVVLVASESGVADIAATDLREMGVGDIRILKDDPEAWRAAGMKVVSTPDEPADSERIDFLFFVHDRHTGNPEASKAYLNWELGLIGQLNDWEKSLFPILDGH